MRSLVQSVPRAGGYRGGQVPVRAAVYMGTAAWDCHCSPWTLCSLCFHGPPALYKEAVLFQKVGAGGLPGAGGQAHATLCIEQMAACGTQVGIPFPSSHQCQPPTTVCSSIPAGYFLPQDRKKNVMLFLHVLP